MYSYMELQSRCPKEGCDVLERIPLKLQHSRIYPLQPLAGLMQRYHEISRYLLIPLDLSTSWTRLLKPSEAILSL